MLKAGLGNDISAVCFLLLLYFLQGVPLGLGASIPLLLQKAGVTYAQQAVFTFAGYPFSFKFLWSGLVDSLYIRHIGRRKSWLFPVQLLIGIFLIFLSVRIDFLLESKNVAVLAACFFILNFLVATQDIVVDGWALTLLSRRNAGAAANCNAAGQTLGAFFGYGFFMALSDPEFCNKWLRSESSPNPMITTASFFAFWGTAFIGLTILIAALKSEKNDVSLKPPPLKETYKTMVDIFKLSSVKTLVLLWFTCNIGSAVAGEASMLKLTERGMSRSTLALLSSYLAPIRILLPMAIERFTSKRALTCWTITAVYGLLSAATSPLIIHFMPKMVLDGTSMYIIVFLSFLDSIFGTVNFVSTMSFHAQISDPVLGGVYMTLLNSAANFGGSWPETFALWTLDKIGDSPIEEPFNLTKIENGEQVLSDFYKWDPIFSLSIICTILGILWFAIFARKLFYLQNLPKKSWLVAHSGSSDKHTSDISYYPLLDDDMASNVIL